MTIHEKIKHIRGQKKMTQKEFSEMLAITQAMLSYIEGGDQVPSYNVLWILINKLKVNPYYLFGDEVAVFASQKRFSNRAKLDHAILTLKKTTDDLTQISL